MQTNDTEYSNEAFEQLRTQLLEQINIRNNRRRYVTRSGRYRLTPINHLLNNDNIPFIYNNITIYARENPATNEWVQVFLVNFPCLSVPNKTYTMENETYSAYHYIYNKLQYKYEHGNHQNLVAMYKTNYSSAGALCFEISVRCNTCNCVIGRLFDSTPLGERQFKTVIRGSVPVTRREVILSKRATSIDSIEVKYYVDNVELTQYVASEIYKQLEKQEKEQEKPIDVS